MTDADYKLIENQWDSLIERSENLYEKWDEQNGPKTPSDHPNERGAYVEGYMQAVIDVKKALNSL